MRFKVFICLFFTFIPLLLLGQSQVDSLLKVLDYCLKNKDIYIDQKNKQIDSLKENLLKQLTPIEQFYLNGKISDSYKYYISDSAIVYLDRNLILAELINSRDLKTENQIQYSGILSSVGIFNEAQKIIESVSYKDLNDSLRLSYFDAYEEFYVHLLDFIGDSKYRDQYNTELAKYRDSALKYIPENTADYFFWKFKSDYVAGRFIEAQDALRNCLARVDTNSHLFAGANFCMSLFYNEFKSDEEKNKKLEYLITAAISDIRSATKENFALISLSNALFVSGDINRAYQYTLHALDDANFYNARYRNLQIGQMLPIIENAYQTKSNKQKRDLVIALAVISILFIGLIFTLFFIRKQMISLSKARKILKEMNVRLKETNNSLEKINLELSESNQIKEIYIGRFLNLCSIYIGKIEDIQNLFNKKSILDKKAGSISSRYIGPDNIIERELKEFYRNFDDAFLTIFPDFVLKFNELMPDEGKILPRENGQLTTELRIFALIRLGITDSNKIASLLRYSLTTIYTYRSRVKNRSLFPVNFEEKIARIGTSGHRQLV